MKKLALCFALLLPSLAFAGTAGNPGGPFPAQVDAIGVQGNDGKVYPMGTESVLVSGTFTRPADTTAYASGDLVANSVTAGSVTPITLTLGRSTAGPGATGMIRRLRLYTSSTSTTNAQFRVHFYSTSPTVTNGDNGAWVSNQVATYLGAIDVTIDKAFSDGAQGVGVPNSGTEINFTAKTIYALVEARAAYTPTSAEVFTIKLEVLQN